MPRIRCDFCEREQEGKAAKTKDVKLPPGWKRLKLPDETREKVFCKDCFKDRYVLRAVTIPVATVIDGGEWKDFWAALKESWAGCTNIANRAVFELARCDSPRKKDDERIAAAPHPYLYDIAKETDDRVSPQSIVALLHAVERRYRETRYEVIWLRKASLPVYRYPVPLPIHNQGWQCLEGDDKKPCVSCRVGDRRWTLALATARHKRALNGWRAILEGRAIQGELCLIGQEVTKSDHRKNGQEREAAGGRRKSIRVMAKLVAWFPRAEPRDDKEGTLYLHTDRYHFWVYHVGKDGDPKYLDAHHVKRWEAQHKKHLQSMSYDLKYEKRWPTPVRKQANERQAIWADKQQDRIDTFCHEVTSMIVKFATRQRVATIVYDPKMKSYINSFPWHKLATQLAYKCDSAGIALEIIGSKEEEKEKKKEEEIVAAE
jgi:hypothetical protein